jgi:hypothetical protein
MHAESMFMALSYTVTPPSGAIWIMDPMIEYSEEGFVMLIVYGYP